MAPAIREVTRTIIEADTTFVNVITLGYHKAYPTLNLVTSTVTTSSTVIQVDSISTPAPEENQIRLVKRSDLSDANKGAIVGTILGVIVFLLLLYYCYICWLQSRGLTPRSVKVALDPQDSTASDPPPSDPDNPPEKRKKKKNVTISSDLPHYLPRYSGSKDTRSSIITPLVRISTEMTLKTGLQTRKGRLGQPVRFMIREGRNRMRRERERPRVKKRRRHRRRHKHKSRADTN